MYTYAYIPTGIQYKGNSLYIIIVDLHLKFNFNRQVKVVLYITVFYNN